MLETPPQLATIKLTERWEGRQPRLNIRAARCALPERSKGLQTYQVALAGVMKLQVVPLALRGRRKGWSAADRRLAASPRLPGRRNQRYLSCIYRHPLLQRPTLELLLLQASAALAPSPVCHGIPGLGLSPAPSRQQRRWNRGCSPAG